MAKPEWGVKRVCPSCAARFYDLMREPITCPACGSSFALEAFTKPRRGKAATVAKAKVVKEPEEEIEEVEDVSNDDDDDDVLEIDDDEVDEDLPETAASSDDDDSADAPIAEIEGDDLLDDDDDDAGDDDEDEMEGFQKEDADGAVVDEDDAKT